MRAGNHEGSLVVLVSHVDWHPRAEGCLEGLEIVVTNRLVQLDVLPLCESEDVGRGGGGRWGGWGCGEGGKMR